MALTTGFETTMLGGYVYITPAKKYSADMAHLLLQVTINSKYHIIDGQFGSSFQMWQLLGFISGKDQPQVSLIYCLRERVDSATWIILEDVSTFQTKNFLILISRKTRNNNKKIYSFTLESEQLKILSLWVHTCRHLQHLHLQAHHFVPCRTQKGFTIWWASLSTVGDSTIRTICIWWSFKFWNRKKLKNYRRICLIFPWRENSRPNMVIHLSLFRVRNKINPCVFISQLTNYHWCPIIYPLYPHIIWKKILHIKSFHQ